MSASALTIIVAVKPLFFVSKFLVTTIIDGDPAKVLNQFTQIMRLDHLGIAVRDIEKSIAYYRETFGFELHSQESIQSQKVKIAFLKLDNTMIELLTPTDPASLLEKFLATRGEGLHHVCYEVEDIVAELARLKSLGLKLIDEAPRVGAHDTLIAFIHPKSSEGVLTELCQYQ